MDIYELIGEHKEAWIGQHREIYNLANTPGCDITEHVSTLIKYGRKCDHIVEMGVRYGWSTRSFLFTEPKRLHSFDKYPWNSISHYGADPKTGNFYYNYYKQLYKDKVDFVMTLADTTSMDPVEECELLFIDTFHHRDALSAELNLHGNRAEKFIIIHDTETYGERGEEDFNGTFVKWKSTSEPGTGLWHAINPWLESNPHWSIAHHYKNNNGLTILARK